METEERKEPLPKGATKTFIVVGAASVVWLFTAVAAGWFAEPCAEGNGTFACLSANEWGDYFAGVFAPLAFFWLIATVWIQSNELKEQRRELILTRKEFEHNRSVLQAQADEARKQAEFIGSQTDMLRTDRAEKEATELFAAHVSLLATRLRQYQHAFSFSPQPNFTSINRMLEVDKDEEDHVIIAWTVAVLRTKVRTLGKSFGDPPQLYSQHPLDLSRLVESVHACWLASQKLPPASRVRAQTLELQEFEHQMLYLKSHTQNYPKEISFLDRIASAVEEISAKIIQP